MHAHNQDLQESELSLAQQYLSTNSPDIEERFPIVVFPEQAGLAPVSAQIAAEFGINNILASILAARGLSCGIELSAWLKPELQQELLLAGEPRNFQLALDIVSTALQGGDRIAICCDYDVDGTSAAAITGRLLSAYGAQVKFYTPDRVQEGYGLNQRMIESALKSGCKTLIALDFGSANHLELELARSKGLKTVVIDHHHINSATNLPQCDAFINPQQQGCGFANGSLCTAGLAYLFAVKMLQRLTPKKELEIEKLQALAALGTISDVVPLIGINRALVKEGLRALATGKVVGLSQLANRAKLDQIRTASDVGYVIGPRINAAGRVGSRLENGNGAAILSVELLLSDNAARCNLRAQDLDSLNRLRREVERNGLAIAIEQVKAQANPDAIVVTSAEIHEGVAGIIASRLVDKFNLPAVVLSQTKDGRLKGSARNVRSMRMSAENDEPLHLAEVLHLLGMKSGGHAAAAGLTIANEEFEEFRKDFADECRKRLMGVDTTAFVTADIVVSARELAAVDREFWEQQELLEPCDNLVNPKVCFGIQNVCVVGHEAIDNFHTKIIVRQSDQNGDAYLVLHSWHAKAASMLAVGQFIDIACTPLRSRRKISGSTENLRDLFELVGFNLKL